LGRAFRGAPHDPRGRHNEQGAHAATPRFAFATRALYTDLLPGASEIAHHVNSNELTRMESHDRARASADAAPMFELIELFYFAYRDFVGDADRLLEVYGFGRAHHRVLHFVSRQPGLTIAALLDILQITKQSLNRVLKELIAQGFIEARAGEVDRRHRQLYATTEGGRLALELANAQTLRFSGAMQRLGPAGEGQAAAFLLAMIGPAERERVTEWLSSRGAAPASPLT
jgi:DNA-binding MarR family transcriptional regulator